MSLLSEADGMTVDYACPRLNNGVGAPQPPKPDWGAGVRLRARSAACQPRRDAVIFGAMMRDGVVSAFARRHGEPPRLVAAAPGRVNLIGEHVDYCGLPVFPMAIQRGITIAASPRADRAMHIANLDSRFEPRAFVLGSDIPARRPGDWANYVQAAGQALVRRYGELRGVDAVVASDLPIAAGLSSSSALVVAVAVAVLAANAVAYEL